MAEVQQEIKKTKRTPENQGEYFYNQKILHVILFASSLALAGSCGLMIFFDYNRSWKDYQRAYQSIEKIRAANELVVVEQVLKDKENEIKKLEGSIKAERRKLKGSKVDVNFLWALFSVKKILEEHRIDPSGLVSVTNLNGLSLFISNQVDGIKEKLVKVLEYRLTDNTKTEAEFTLSGIEASGWSNKIKNESKQYVERLNTIVSQFSSEVSYQNLETILESLEGLYQSIKQQSEFSQADYTYYRWKFEETKHKYDESEKDHEINRKKAETEFLEAKAGFDAVLDAKSARFAVRKVVESFRRSVKFAVKIHERNVESVSDKLKDLLKDKESILTRIADIKDTLGNKLRNAPLLDFYGSTLQVKQTVVQNIYDEFHFAKPQKVDRCQTCHIAIDNPAYEAFKTPDGKYKFKNEVLQKSFEQAFPSQADREKYIRALIAHPKTDLYVMSSSKHPMDKFGCTSCHDGDGKETEFSLAVHTPANSEQTEDWHKKYGYFHRELWDSPMLPARFYESSCRRCHNQEMSLYGAEKYNLGMQVYERAGCYACHKTNSYPLLLKHLQQAGGAIDESDLTKRPGPPLTEIKKKVDKAWTYNWILSPRSFRPTTRMPHFFLQPNSRDYVTEDGEIFESPIQDQVKSAVLAEYIYSLTSDKEEYYPQIEKIGDPIRGEKITNSVGCYACHKFDEKYDANYFKDGTPLLDEFGPNLAGSATKFNSEASKRWLYNWVKDPKHYNKGSRMPSLRLTDQEAADITAYLTSDSLRVDNEDRKTRQLAVWSLESAPLSVDNGSVSFKKTGFKKIVDGLLLEEFKKGLSIYDAKKKLDQISEYEKVKILGKEMVKAYGCYSCHEMNDVTLKDSQQWTSLEGIGVELTGTQSWGNKALDKLDFGKTKYDGENHKGLVFKHPLDLEQTYHGQKPVNINQLDDFKKGGEFDIKLHHTKPEWLYNKVRNPRLYDTGLLESKPADELTKMPNFNLTPREAELVTTFVLSFTNHLETGLTRDVKKVLTPEQSIYHKGLKIVRESNCSGCHVFDSDKLLVKYFKDRSGSRDEVKEWLNGMVSDNVPANLDSFRIYLGKLLQGYLLSPLLHDFADLPTSELLQKIKTKFADVNIEELAKYVMSFIDRQKAEDSHSGVSSFTDDLKELDIDALKSLVEESFILLNDDVDSIFAGDEAELLKKIDEWKGIVIINNELFLVVKSQGDNQRYYIPVPIAPALRMSWIVNNRDLKSSIYQNSSNLVYKGQIKDHIRQWGGDIISHIADYKVKSGEITPAEISRVIPPYLITQGKKTQPQWLFNFLKQPFHMRQSLLSAYEGDIPKVVNVRMPTYDFTDRQAQIIVDFFGAKDLAVNEPYYMRKDISVESQYKFTKENLAKIVYLYYVFGFNCKSCHKVNGEGSTVAPDLAGVGDRLTVNWMDNFFTDPAKVYPGTAMPIPNTVTPMTGDFDSAKRYTAIILSILPYVEHVKEELLKLQKQIELVELTTASGKYDTQLVKLYIDSIKQGVVKYRDVIAYDNFENDVNEIFARDPGQPLSKLSEYAPIYDAVKKINKKTIINSLNRIRGVSGVNEILDIIGR